MATGTRAGRKRKSPKDWAAENDDFFVKKRKSDGSDSETDGFVSKYCSVEINISGKGWDWVNEHIGSKRHAKLKETYVKRMAEVKQQLTL